MGLTIRVSRAQPFGYIITPEDGGSPILVQTDWDYPGTLSARHGGAIYWPTTTRGTADPHGGA